MPTLTAPRSLVSAVQANTAALVVIDTLGHRLRADAAASVARMRAAGCPTGVVTSAWRSTSEQLAQVARAAAGQTPSAAAVGTSWHEAGLAVDWPLPARAWVRAHGAGHGWTFTLTSEPWHAVYDAADDQHIPTPTAPAATTTTPLGDKVLILAKLKTDPRVWIGDGITRRHVKTLEELADLQYRLRTGALPGAPTATDKGAVLSVDRIDWLGQAL